MTDTDAAGPETNGAGAPEPGIRILAQFIRDLSFENPRAPETLRAQNATQPQIEMGVEMNARGREDGLFEVDLKLSVKATGDDKNAVFHVELVYGGLFALSGVAPQDIEPMLLIECPRYLFPFARQVIAQATSDGGFYPPFMVDPIDFAAIYIARQQQIASGPADAGQA